MKTALDRVRKNKIPSRGDGFENIAIENFSIEREHFFVETFPGIVFEVFTGCRGRRHCTDVCCSDLNGLLTADLVECDSFHHWIDTLARYDRLLCAT